MNVSNSKPDEKNSESVLDDSLIFCRGQAKETLENEGKDELINIFFISVQLGNLQAVSDCLNCGVSPNVRQADSTNALHVTAELGNVDLGRLLLSRKETDIDMKTSLGFTPLHIACYFEKKKFVELLLQNDANLNCKTINNATLLHTVTVQQNYNLLSLLLSNGANPNVLDNFCDTPLSNCVIREPNFDMAKLLIVDYKVDTNLHCKGLLHILLDLAQSCRTQNQLRFAELLIENGVDINTTHEATSKNALHYAAMVGYEPMISLLLNSGVSTTQKDVWNRTPLHIAEQHGNEDAVYILLAYETRQNYGKK